MGARIMTHLLLLLLSCPPSYEFTMRAPTSGMGAYRLQAKLSPAAALRRAPRCPAAKMNVPMERADGLHGTKGRFMPAIQVQKDEFVPRLIPIAGFYPGVTSADFQDPVIIPNGEKGELNFHFFDTNTAPKGCVNLPGALLLSKIPRPLAVLTPNTMVGLEVPGGLEKEVVLVVDVDDAAVSNPAKMDPKMFYVFAAPDGNVAIRWLDGLPEGWSVVARVLYGMIPYPQDARKTASGWAEDDEEFEFT